MFKKASNGSLSLMCNGGGKHNSILLLQWRIECSDMVFHHPDLRLYLHQVFDSFFNNGGSYYQASRAAINMFYPCVVFNEHQEHQSLVVFACVSILQLSDLHMVFSGVIRLNINSPANQEHCPTSV